MRTLPNLFGMNDTLSPASLALRLATAITSLRASMSVVSPTSRPAVLMEAILLSFEVGDHATALLEIRHFGDAAEAAGVASSMKRVFEKLLDAHALCRLVSLAGNREPGAEAGA